MALLPTPLPADPLALLDAWLTDASRELAAHNPSAMSLATVSPDGAPSARMVICRGYDAERGYVVFYTDRDSPKGRDLDATQRAAAIFYWQPFDRQIRIEGPVLRSPDSESDAYFHSRPPGAQVSARASRQSRRLGAREALEAAQRDEVERFEHQIARGEPTRPPRWGGYRIWIASLEFWLGQPDRLHDRARFTRELAANGDGFDAGPWSSTRLEP